MKTWTKRERFMANVNGETADRPPVSAWRHFIDREQTSEGLADAMIEFQTKFDWDFVKMNPRATYYAEAWGNRYHYDDYDGVVARVSNYVVKKANDLEDITELQGNAGPFGEQLDAIKQIRKGVGEDVPLLQTVFSPLAVLEYLAGHRTLAGNRPAVRAATPLPELFAANPEGVHRALHNIACTLASYVRKSLQAGADGFFYALLGLARDGYLTEDEFEKFVRPYDLIVLEELKDAATVLHTCGPYANPERFKDYPVQVLHWADHEKGNPTLKDSSSWIGDKAVMGGVEERLFSSNNPSEVISQAKYAMNVMSNRPFILAPGCGVSLNASSDNLFAFRQAAIVD